jgi:hypothetical protein
MYDNPLDSIGFYAESWENLGEPGRTYTKSGVEYFGEHFSPRFSQVSPKVR